MQVSVETIAGKLHTVIWYTNDVRVWEKQNWKATRGGGYMAFFHGEDDDSHHIATALPALQRHPKPEDAALLYRYASEGLTVCGESIDNNGKNHLFCFVGSGSKGMYTEHNPPHDARVNLDWFRHYPVTHAIDSTGQRVEIAIAAGKDGG